MASMAMPKAWATAKYNGDTAGYENWESQVKSAFGGKGGKGDQVARVDACACAAEACICVQGVFGYNSGIRCPIGISINITIFIFNRFFHR